MQYIEVSQSVKSLQEIIRMYKDKNDFYLQEISKLKKKYNEVKLSNIDLLIERDKKNSELELLLKKNENSNEFIKSLTNKSQNYLEKIENYKKFLDEFFDQVKKNNINSSQSANSNVIEKAFDDIKKVIKKNIRFLISLIS